MPGSSVDEVGHVSEGLSQPSGVTLNIQAKLSLSRSLIGVDRPHPLPILRIGRLNVPPEVCYENVRRQIVLLHRQFLSKID